MILSAYEKELIKIVSIYSTFTLQTWLKENCKYEIKTYFGHTIQYHFGDIYDLSQIIVLEDRNIVYNKIVALVSLLDKLQKSNLFYIISTSNKSKIQLFRINESGEQAFDKDLTDIFYEFSDKYYVPMLELHEFVMYDCKTQQERKEEKEQKEKEIRDAREQKYRDEERKISIENQERSFQQTRKIAYISIAVSIIVAITTAIINIYTYTNERYVKITNTEPSKVEIVNPEVKQMISSKSVNKINNDDKIQVAKSK